MSMKKGDLVKVISGAGTIKGLIGKIIRIDRKKDRVVLENAPSKKRHLKPQKHPRYPEGGIIESPISVHRSNVMLMSEALNRPVRVGHVLSPDNKKTRICRGKGTSGEVI